MAIKKRTVYLLAATAFFLSALLIILAPAILSSKWMEKTLLSAVNQEINGSLEIESMRLSWLGPQQISGAKLSTRKGALIASTHFLEVDHSLFTVLIYPSAIRNIRVDNLNIEIGDQLIQTLGEKYFPKELKGNEPVKLVNTNLLIDGLERSWKLMLNGSTEHKRSTGIIELDVNRTDEKSHISANITNFPVEILDVLASLSNPNYYGVFQELIGSTLDISIQDVSLLNQSTIQILLKSEFINFSMNGLVKDNLFQLTTNATGSLTLVPSAAAELLAAANQKSPFQLVKPINIDIKIRDTIIPLDFFNGVLENSMSQQLATDVIVQIPEFEWVLNKQKSVVKGLDFQLTALAGQPSLDLIFDGEFYQEGKTFPFLLRSVHHKPVNIDELIVSVIQPQRISFAFNDLETKNLDNLFGTGNQWQTIFGNTISLQLLSEDNDLHALSMTLNSDLIDIGKMQLKIDQTMVLGQDLRSKPLSGQLLADQILFKKEKSSLDQFNVNWEIDPRNNTAAADFSGRTRFKDTQIKGGVSGSFFADYSNTENYTVQLEIQGNQVPAPFVSLATGRKEWGPIFGPVLDFTINAHMKDLSGPIGAEVNGSNGKLRFHGKLSQGILTLDSPLHLSTKATSQLANDVLTDFAPVFGQMLSADQPISLDIDAEAFTMPISFNYSQMNFKRATLNLGKMTFQNQGDINRLLTVLKAGNPSHVEVWATPMYLSMDQGTLTIHRMDMLVLNRYPIATWGSINLVEDKVNMVLGLSPAALAQSLGITGLSKDYMLQIPIKGSTTNTKIHSAKVMSRIGALVAQSSGGPEGLVLGTVWDIANGREPKIPKPTTQPFPWGNASISNNPGNQKSDSINPLNGIRKEAKKLIKDIFR